MTNEDHDILSAMIAHGGGFVRRLAEAGLIADDENLEKIKGAWPEYWKTYQAIARLKASKPQSVLGGLHDLKVGDARRDPEYVRAGYTAQSDYDADVRRGVVGPRRLEIIL